MAQYDVTAVIVVTTVIVVTSPNIEFKSKKETNKSETQMVK